MTGVDEAGAEKQAPEQQDTPILRPRGPRARKSASKGIVHFLPPALLTLVIAVLAVPMGLGIAAGLIGPGFPGAAGAPGPKVPDWQQVPKQLSRTQIVAPLDASAPVPLPAEVTNQLNALLTPDGGGDFTGVVEDALTGLPLYDRDGAKNRVPASNMKLLTAVAALRAIGPETRFSTRVLAGPSPSTIILSAGGDVLLGDGPSQANEVLGHAGLETLAADTAKALQDRGVKGPVTVQLDDGLFTGPALNPSWSLDDVAAGETAPVFPLALNSARTTPGATSGPRPQDAALTAAQAFAGKLQAAGAAAGFTVVPGVERAAAPTGKQGVLASAVSATVREQVDLMLETSDNYLAEVFGRMAALSEGKPGSNDGATAAVGAQLAELGVASDSMHLADVSGLALGNQVSARQFADVVRAITSGPDTRLRAALAGFPVAGLTGTLGDRYTDATTSQGAGLVRAKTGTLNSVIALSGYVVDANGRLLVFSFIGNGLMPGAEGNKVALDRSATALASCGCRAG
ncbi:D-alanyl-D-alanine carboxypeptidase/D-alanyl-D-alanine endopeptidase [Arthrobacter bambusae]|nr:D-alanyl-D-alanine carboxypeptidase/D-alanyl-D-alanine-endopeptidase (penicillin-binding protein 4) [Arthrobacter bambusae]MDQ0234345.1 D-alanyl-D-alanine carboxypeptidase/D-alanyl-D-alanine-endopeptidase (penicillin-binding protein 4) [Arthrobacter bambusae]